MKQTTVMLTVLFATAVYGIHLSARAGDSELSGNFGVDSGSSVSDDDEGSSLAFNAASNERRHKIPSSSELALESAQQEAQRACDSDADKDPKTEKRSPVASVRLELMSTRWQVSSGDKNKPREMAVRLERAHGIVITIKPDPKIKWTEARAELLNLRAERVLDNQSKLGGRVTHTVDQETVSTGCAQALLAYGLEAALQGK